MTDYPYPDPNLPAAFKRGVIERLATANETRRVAAREARRNDDARLTPIKNVRPLAGNDVPLVYLIRDDLKLVPAFLAHYRRLGVTRFICVDDQSTDGSRELLADQPDVDLWTSPLRYKDARRGRVWREFLFRHYGHDRWYVNVDSDEFLFYETCETTPLPTLFRSLEAVGQKRLLAPMLDLYPVQPLAAAAYGNQPGQMPWEIATHFDGSGFRLETIKRGVTMTGGPRVRKFGYRLELVKFPVIFWDSKCGMGVSVHQPLPFQRNHVPPQGVLLHFKFFSDYREKIEAAAESGQYYDSSAAYQGMRDALTNDSELDFDYEGSVRFDGTSSQLRKLGFFGALPAPGAS